MGSHQRSGSLDKLSMFIDGIPSAPALGEYFETFDPFTARPWALVPRGTAEDADRAVQAAHRAFTEGDWSRLHPSKRGQLMHRLARISQTP